MPTAKTLKKLNLKESSKHVIKNQMLSNAHSNVKKENLIRSSVLIIAVLALVNLFFF